jgi:hypothetical protein
VGVVSDEYEAIAKAYSFVLDEPTIGLSDQIGEGYQGREIDEGVFFGIDERVLAAIREPLLAASARRRRLNDIFSILSDQAQAYESRRDSDTFSGRDGTIFVDRRNTGSRRRRSAQL